MRIVTWDAMKARKKQLTNLYLRRFFSIDGQFSKQKSSITISLLLGGEKHSINEDERLFSNILFNRLITNIS